MERLPPRCRPPVGLVRPVAIDPTGTTGPTRGAARGERWRRVGWNLYVPSDAPGCVEQRIVEAAARSAGAVVTGWAALRLAGVAFLDGRDARGRTMPVPLRVGSGGLRDRSGVIVRRGLPAEREVVELAGTRCAGLELAVRDAVRSVAPAEAVVVLDAVLAAGLVDRDLVLAWGRARGAPLALGRAAGACRAGVRSPRETLLRLLCDAEAARARERGAARGPLLVNPSLEDDAGGWLPSPDLLDDRHGVALEFDGAYHRDADQHRVDVDRFARHRRAGLEVVPFVGADLHHRERVFRRIDEAYTRAGSLPRRWVVVRHPTDAPGT